MKIPLEWLNDYVTIRLTPEALAERLTMAGLEVTGIERVDGQPVLDLEITPNRADCLSIIGVAREVAVMTGQRLKPSKLGIRNSEFGVRRKIRTPHSALRIRIEDRKGCQRYVGRLIEDVRIGPSPAWMQERLIACGLRPINNVVDITNYVLFELGQPLHTFDFDRLTQGTVLVRRAQPRESITTLDGVKRTLSAAMLVIADAKQVVAIAGVMGGVGSEVTGRTRRVLLESALFDPVMVRRTARQLGLASESSYRFERGVDPVGVEAASARAASLIQQLAGGSLCVVRDVGAKPGKKTVIILDARQANRWLGTVFPPTTMRGLLAKLSCRVASSGAGEIQRVEIPSFRRDLARDVDLYEELARLAGYERLPVRLPSASMATRCAESPSSYWRMQSLRCLCASLGLTETINWALVSEAELVRCGQATDQAVRLSNPLSQDFTYLRSSLVPGLLRSVRRNLTQGVADVRLFEVGNVFPPRSKGVSLEVPRLGMALAGVWVRDWRTNEPSDFFRLKGIVAAILSRLCDADAQAYPAEVPWSEPGRGAHLMIGGEPIGQIGQVAKTVAADLDIDENVFVAELFIDRFLAIKHSATKAASPPMVPPVKRDLSVVVNDDTAFEAVHRTIREVARALAVRVELIDRYTGNQVPKDHHSLTFSIDYRDPVRTLTAEEIDAVHRHIGEALVQRFSAQLR